MSTSTTDRSTNRRGRRPWWIVFALVLTVVAFGVFHAWGTQDVRAGDAHVLVAGRNPWPGSKLNVAYSGAVILVGKCVGVSTVDGKMVLLWPPGTGVSGSKRSLELKVGGTKVRLGDHITFGRYQSARASAPKACGRGAEFVRAFDISLKKD